MSVLSLLCTYNLSFQACASSSYPPIYTHTFILSEPLIMTASRAGSIRNGSRPGSVYAKDFTKEPGTQKYWARGNNSISPGGAAAASLRINTNVSSVRKKSVSPYFFPILSASEYINQKRAPGDSIDAMRAHCSSEPGEGSLESSGTLIRRSIALSTEVTAETPDDY